MQVISELLFQNFHFPTASEPVECADCTSLIQVFLVLQPNPFVSDYGRTMWLALAKHLRSVGAIVQQTV